MHVLIAAENNHRAYREAIARAIGTLRPHLEVSVADLEQLKEELAHLDPDVVVCGRSEPAEPGCALVWIEFSVDPKRSTKIRAGGHSWEVSNPALGDLLSVIDEAEVYWRSTLVAV